MNRTKSKYFCYVKPLYNMLGELTTQSLTPMMQTTPIPVCHGFPSPEFGRLDQPGGYMVGPYPDGVNLQMTSVRDFSTPANFSPFDPNMQFNRLHQNHSNTVRVLQKALPSDLYRLRHPNNVSPMHTAIEGVNANSTVVLCASVLEISPSNSAHAIFLNEFMTLSFELMFCKYTDDIRTKSVGYDQLVAESAASGVRDPWLETIEALANLTKISASQLLGPDGILSGQGAQGSENPGEKTAFDFELTVTPHFMVTELKAVARFLPEVSY